MKKMSLILCKILLGKIALRNLICDYFSRERLIIATDRHIPLNRKVFIRDIPSKGPSAVWDSVINGLIKLKICFTIYCHKNKVRPSLNKSGNKWIILQWSGENRALVHFLDQIVSERVLLGPNINLNRELIGYLSSNPNKYRYFLSPSSFVTQNHLKFSKNGIKLQTWAAGVNHLLYADEESLEKNQVGIYVKGSLSLQDRKNVKLISDEYKDNVVLLEYGQYQPREWITHLKKFKIIFWFGSTESQGLAMIEAWSANVPTAVRYKRSIFDDNHPSQLAFSPYHDGKTGYFFEEYESALDSFTQSKFLSNLNPRLKVLHDFKNEVTTMKLLELL
jgi:hypothetical protein